MGPFVEEPFYNHHPVEDIEPAEEHPTTDLGEAVAQLFAIVLGEKLKGGWNRFCALAWLISPERYFDGRNETQAAKLLGLPKGEFSRLVLEVSDLTGIRNPFLKRHGARGVYAERQRRVWEEREGETIETQTFLNV